jgi:hypothetical protein
LLNTIISDSFEVNSGNKILENRWLITALSLTFQARDFSIATYGFCAYFATLIIKSAAGLACIDAGLNEELDWAISIFDGNVLQSYFISLRFVSITRLPVIGVLWGVNSIKIIGRHNRIEHGRERQVYDKHGCHHPFGPDWIRTFAAE